VATNADTAILDSDVPTLRVAGDLEEKRAVTAVAPLRIDLTGGFTDIPPFSSCVDSLHINAAFDLAVTVRCQTRRDRDVRVDFSRERNPGTTGMSEGRRRFLEAVRAGVAEFAGDGGLDLSIRSDAPAGSGLGSSGAILVAAISGCATLTGVTLTEAALARKAITAAAVAGIVGGQQDEFSAAHGSLRAYAFERRGAVEIRDFPATDLPRNLEKSLLVAQMGAGGRRTDVVADVVRAVRSSDQETIRALLHLQELAQDLWEVMNTSMGEEFPRCLQRIREAQCALHPRMCCPTVASALEAVRGEIPELEYKMLGGGGVGSCVLIYVPPQLRSRATSLLRSRAKKISAVRIQPSGVFADFIRAGGTAARHS
jgi:D-glycero-alpha-D-manno-heptose-7-phosphate kinase